jgi:hypothetical protein
MTRAEKLLIVVFTRNGKPCASAVHTSQGTMPLWGQLVLAGYVKEIPRLFHEFNYELTEKGQEFLANFTLTSLAK